MSVTSLLSTRGRRAGHLFVGPAVLALTLLAALPATAGATIRIINHNDPAGDPTLQPYQLQAPTLVSPLAATLTDGEYRSFGPGPGTYTIQAFPPTGWKVADIQCVGPSPNDFAVDVPNGRVTLTHGQGVEQTCSFTNRKGTASSGGQPPSTGVAPAPPASELSKVVLPRGPALVKVGAGRRFASATVRITQRSVIKAQLLWRGKQVVGSTRVSHAPGTHLVKVTVRGKSRRQLLHRGLTRTTFTLRVTVVGRNGATRVFRYRVLVRLT